MATTPNFGWTLATVGGDNNAWGGILNTLFNAIDADLQTTLDVAEEALDGVTVLDDAGVLDEQAGKKLYISYAAFAPNNDEDDNVFGSGSGAYVLTDNNSDTDLFASISLPQGVTITQVDLICDKNTNTSVTATLHKVVAATGVVSTLGTGSRSSSGVGAATISGLSEVVGANFYTLRVEFAPLGAAGIKVYGAIVTYTQHDLSEVM